VRVERGVAGRVEVVLQHVERARVAAAGHGVDEHEHVVAVEELVGQVHAADAGVDELDVRGQLPLAQRGDHRDAEAVVGEERVADPGHEDLHVGTSSSSGRK
jgi:hypothetical protein